MKKFKDNEKGLKEVWKFTEKASGEFCVLVGNYRALFSFGTAPNGERKCWSLRYLPTPGQWLAGTFTPLEEA